MREHEFTSRFREVGQPEIDALIGVYNRMVDHLRDERMRLRSSTIFSARSCRSRRPASSCSTSTSASAPINPAPSGCSTCRRPHASAGGSTELASPLTEALVALASRRVAASSACTARGASSAITARSSIAAFARSFLLLEELTEELRQFEKAAYEKLIRVMSHEVNNTVAASNSLLHSLLTYAGELTPANRQDFEQAIGIVIERTEQLNGFMRASPTCSACRRRSRAERSAGRSSRTSCGC